MSELSRSHAADIADTRFAAAIREAGQLAVRAMSGYGMAADRAQTKQAGFLEHLVKPIKFDQLDRVLREIAPVAA